MSIELTENQQKTLDTEAKGLPRVVDPRTKATYILVPEQEYEGIREILEDERQQRAIREIALRNAAGRMNEAP